MKNVSAALGDTLPLRTRSTHFVPSPLQSTYVQRQRACQGVCEHSALPLRSAQAAPPKLPSDSCHLLCPFLPASPGVVDTLPSLHSISTEF